LRLVSEAPGHLFLDHESTDLKSFLFLGIVCGWDMSLVPSVGYATAFVSHDEWVEFSVDHQYQVEELVAEAAKNHLRQK
jgi:hypothetical protein